MFFRQHNLLIETLVQIDSEIMNIVAAAKRMKENHDMKQQIENPIAEQNYSIAGDD